MSEESRPDCAQLSRFEPGDFMPPTAEAPADFERPSLHVALRGPLPLVFGQAVVTLADGAYRSTSRLTLPRRAAFIADAPTAPYLPLAVPCVQEGCTLLTLRRVGEQQHAALLQMREAAAMDAAAGVGRTVRLPPAGALPAGQPAGPAGRWGAQAQPAQPAFW